MNSVKTCYVQAHTHNFSYSGTLSEITRIVDVYKAINCYSKGTKQQMQALIQCHGLTKRYFSTDSEKAATIPITLND